ncbi:phosphopyruvate hydratase [candidate division WOR-3 bacterium]|nr:phosphopyruvate hydratase [candidate division WOR-3 bacterium]
MSMISGIFAREILDSRGNPTIQTECFLETGEIGVASVPSGASTGSHEAVELRDNDKSRYNGKGVLEAVKNVNDEIADEMIGMDAVYQGEIDSLLIQLDGTSNKSRLGANAILSVSLAAAKAATQFCDLPLYRYLGGVFARTIPVPMCNVLNGGKHAVGGVDFQEFMIVPVGALTFTEAIRQASETYHALLRLVLEKGYSAGLGDEGGVAPSLKRNEEAMELIIEAIEKAGYSPGEDIAIAIDPAVSEIYENGYYNLARENKKLSTDDMISLWLSWIEKYPLVSIEDGLAEDDWEGWKKLKKAIKGKIQLVGDDIFVTNPERLAKGISNDCANSVLIKLNQIGTLTETLECVEMAKTNGWTTVISHRSGETSDTTIADLSVAVNSGQIKTGAPARSERVEKYNRLMLIEEELGQNSYYPGSKAFA